MPVARSRPLGGILWCHLLPGILAAARLNFLPDLKCATPAPAPGPLYALPFLPATHSRAGIQWCSVPLSQQCLNCCKTKVYPVLSFLRPAGSCPRSSKEKILRA